MVLGFLPVSVAMDLGGPAVTQWVWAQLPIPSQSQFRIRWDAVMAVVMFYIITCVPIRIGFRLSDWKPWMVPDLLTDLLLIADMLIWSVTCYEVEGEEVRDLDAIRRHYLRGAFILDLATIFPLELFAACFMKYEPWLRCNRLLRLLNMGYYFRLWEMVSFLKPSIIRIINSCVTVLMLGHFIACAFFLLIILEGDKAASGFTGHPDILSLPFASQYLRAYHWAFVTMTGYNNTNPGTDAETVFYIIADLLGISIVGATIGVVGDLIQNLDSSALFFRQKIDTMNDYMRYKQIPGDLQEEVRNYYTYLWRSGKGLEQNKVLDDLPLSLKNRLSVALNSDNIKKVPLFERVKDDEAFISEVVKCLKPQIFLPNSFVVRKGEVGTQMFFIYRGELAVVSDDDQVVLTLRDGGFFGEIALLYDTKRTATIVARTYCDLFVLNKEDLKKVMKKFPEQSKVIQEVAHERFQHIVETQRKKEVSEDGSESSVMSMTNDPVFNPSPPKGRLSARSGRSGASGQTRFTHSVSTGHSLYPHHRKSTSYITNTSGIAPGQSFATTHWSHAATRQDANLNCSPRTVASETVIL
eukprot:EG_transcript_4893